MIDLKPEDLSRAKSVGNGAIAHKDDWMKRGGRPMKRRAAKLQAVARPKKFIPTTSPMRDKETGE